MEYEITWRIQLEAETPDEAAREALNIVRDEGSDATVFEVTNRDTGEMEEIDAALLSDAEMAELEGFHGTNGIDGALGEEF